MGNRQPTQISRGHGPYTMEKENNSVHRKCKWHLRYNICFNIQCWVFSLLSTSTQTHIKYSFNRFNINIISNIIAPFDGLAAAEVSIYMHFLSTGRHSFFINYNLLHLLFCVFSFWSSNKSPTEPDANVTRLVEIHFPTFTSFASKSIG